MILQRELFTLTNELRADFVHRLRSCHEIKFLQSNAFGDGNYLLDIDQHWNTPYDNTARRYAIWRDKLPTDYESGETADLKTVARIDEWLIKRAKALHNTLTALLKTIGELSEHQN